MRGRQWLTVGCCVIFCSMVCGCLAFVETQEPPATWMPLPTLAPTETPLPPSATPTSTLTPRPPTATADATETARIKDALAHADEIRDHAWTHVVETYPHLPFPLTPLWQRSVEDTAEDRKVVYTSGVWRVVIWMPQTSSEQDLYAVNVVGPDSFSWQAEIDEEGAILSQTPTVTATPTPTPERVEAWRGKVGSLPGDSAFDDYFRRLGGGGGQYGIEGVDSQTEQGIIRWRDSGRIVKVWGVLQRDVEDYGNMRVGVERIEAEPPPTTPVPESELVEGWIGTVHALPSQSPYDDYFRGQSPTGQYGIASHVGNLAQELVEYRDTGTVIRIWGVLDYGVADYGEKRITVTRLQVVER